MRAAPAGSLEIDHELLSGGRRVTAAEPAEILVWEMHATLG